MPRRAIASPYVAEKALERYGLELTPDQLRTIAERAAAQVNAGIAIRLTHTRSHCPVEWGGAILHVVWSKSRKAIVTFLPPDAMKEAA